MNEMVEVQNESGVLANLNGLPPEIQARILEASEQLAGSSRASVSKIRNDAKSYIMPDGTEVDSFSGIIVGVKHANIHYKGTYEEGIVNPPDCVAIHEGNKDASCSDLVPHPRVEAKYSPTCKDCPKFQWGSDRGGKGKGKECGEHTLLAVYVPALDDTLYVVEEKKANSRDCDTYLNRIRKKYGHPITVHTKFIIGEKTKYEQGFKDEALVAPELLANLAERIEEAEDILYNRVIGAYEAGLKAENEVTEDADENLRGKRSK